MTPIFTGRVIEGKLILDNPQGFKEYYSLFNRKEVQITIEKKKKKRSTNQNAYYRGVVVKILAQELGYSPDEMHETLKAHFNRDWDEKLAMHRVKSTTDLSTEDFETYLENVRVWAASQMGIDIPLPNEVNF